MFGESQGVGFLLSCDSHLLHSAEYKGNLGWLAEMKTSKLQASKAEQTKTHF